MHKTAELWGSAPHLRNLCLLIHFITQEYDFYRAHFLSLFNLDASSLTNRDEGLDIVIPMAAKHLCDLIEGETDLDKIKLLLDQYFLEKVAAASDHG